MTTKQPNLRDDVERYLSEFKVVSDILQKYYGPTVPTPDTGVSEIMYRAGQASVPMTLDSIIGEIEDRSNTEAT